MSTMNDTGAVPIEEFAEIRSEVHHLQRDLGEHRQDMRGRIDKIETEVDGVKESVLGFGSDLKHLSTIMIWIGGGIGAVLLTVLGAVLTMLLSGHR
jgi:hypothetical protein